MPKPIEEIQKRYRDASAEFKEAERELNAATSSETKAMLPLIGQTIVDAIYYDDGEGNYQLTLSNGMVVTFSAQGDDATIVTMSTEGGE